jgi:speckle-type POZ protein
MDSASAVIEFKVNFEQAMHLAAGKAVHSDAFSAGGYVWRINFFPNGFALMEVGDESREELSICLELVSKSFNVKAIFEVLLIDKDYGQPVLLAGLVTRQSREPYAHSLIWNVSLPDNTDNLIHKYVNDGYIKFLCTIRVLAGKLIPVPPSDIVKHLGILLDTADGTDVAFTVDGETFHAHRAVLAARSPVFRAELLGSMAEATMTHINLHDITPATFKVMLQFMYTDSLPGDDELGDAPTEMLEHLLAAADRYALDRLKLLCAQKLWDIVSVDTMATTLACAEMYSCLELKQRCIGFFAVKKNFKKAVLTEGFVKLVQRFPSIIVELRDGVEA